MLFRSLTRACATSSALSMSAVVDWSATFDNSLLRDLRPEPPGKDPHESRQVTGAHYTLVKPTVTAPKPELVAFSEDVATLVGLDPAACESEPDFAAFFAGQLPKNANVQSWATAYGASFAGNYGGQRGDGRAISLGQVQSGYEVQLKGAGTTPYSRRFDGKAVLRSSVREFLASEAMAALRVPTTRALCVVTTGDQVLRQWYADSPEGGGNTVERPMREEGAVGTRVAVSFLRFGQMELFYQNDEIGLLTELAQHALDREFAHLRLQSPSAPLSELIVQMFEEVCERQGECHRRAKPPTRDDEGRHCPCVNEWSALRIP